MRSRPVVGAMLVGLLSFAYLIALPPTLNPADESFLLYGAKRILDGEALYRDFFDFVTPGSFYAYAAAYGVGGVSITTARVTTALLNATSAALTYLLTLRVAAPAEAVLAGLLVPVLCCAGWNQASHHWLATTLGLASATILLAPRWQDSPRGRPGAAGALAGAFICTSQGRGLWMLPWLAVAVPGLAIARGDPRRVRSAACQIAWAVTGGAVVCSLLLGFAVARSSFDEVRYATNEWVLTNYRRYNVGRVSWGGSLWQGALLQYTSLWLVKAVPAILALEALALLAGVRRHGLRAELVRVLLLLLAVLMAASILYFPDYVHVLFIMPFALPVLAGLVHRARVRVRSRPGNALLAVAWAGMLAAVALKGWETQRLVRRENPVRFHTAYGTIAGAPLQATLFAALRTHLRPEGSAAPHLFAYPTDAWLYLALPADNPTPFALLRPVYNTPDQIGTAMQRLEQDPASIVLVNMLHTKPRDPFLTFLTGRYREVVPLGVPFFRLFLPRRDSAPAPASGRPLVTAPSTPAAASP